MSSWHTTPLTSLLTAIGPTGTLFYLLPNMQSTNASPVTTTTTPQDYSSSSSQLPTKTLLLENAKQMHNIIYPASASSTQKHSSNIKAQHDSSKPLREFTAGSKVMLRKPPRSPINRSPLKMFMLPSSSSIIRTSSNNLHLKTPHVGSVPDPQLFFLLYPPILPFSSFPFLLVYFEAMLKIHSYKIFSRFKNKARSRQYKIALALPPRNNYKAHFLGLANYYYKFTHHLTKMVKLC
ncbi:hypothetical protein QOT17_021957 [Balamuthia mandrillaris]